MHNAHNTFIMDEIIGCARVNVQFGDDDTSIEVTKELLVNIKWLNARNSNTLTYKLR